jgi:predicted dehydrogenase
MTPSDRRQFLVTSAGSAAVMALSPSLELLAAAPARLPEPLDVALIGAGRQGRAILGELAKLPDVRVVGVCDVIESRLSSGVRRVSGAKGYASHAELLAAHPTVRAVFVATPTHVHRAPVLDCLQAGKHVYCEGPLASTLDDCRAMVRAARGSKGVLQTGMQGRSNPIYTLARSFLRGGAIRDVAAMRAQYHKKTSWRSPASNPADEAALNWQLDEKVSLGLVGELGVHQLDVVHHFLDAYPTAVRGAGSIQLHADGRKVADTVQCEFVFPGERRLVWEGTLANSFEGTYELFCGSMGAIKLAWNAGWLFKEADAPTQGWEVYANRQQFHDEQGITLIADATKLAAQDKLKEGVGLPHPPLYYALVDFLKSVSEGAPVACSAEEGLRAASVAIHAAQAVAGGTSVTIDPASFTTE